jgi:hypothetical protein
MYRTHEPYAAGVLPFTKVKGKVLWLVAEDVRDGSFSDFGGKAERFDHDTIDGMTPQEMTAMREFMEESYGLVVTDAQLLSIFKSKKYVALQSLTRAHHPYSAYIIQVPFSPHIRDATQKILGFFRMRNVYRSFVEKTDIRWVTTRELFGPLSKRAVFSNTINVHRELIESIENGRWDDIVAGASRGEARRERPTLC